MSAKDFLILPNVLIEEIGLEGKGVGKYDGKVIFVNYAVPGDIIDVKITKSKKNYSEGTILKIISPSPNRTQPFCTHFGVCGGCQLQMLPYNLQLEYKENIIVKQFVFNFPEDQLNFQKIISADIITEFRNKLEYSFSQEEYLPDELYQNPILKKNSTGAAGFHVKGNFKKVLAIDNCHLQNSIGNKIRHFIVHFLKINDLPFYHIMQHSGWMRNLVLKNTVNNQWLIVIVVHYHHDAIFLLTDQLISNFPEITAIFYVINAKLNDNLQDLEFKKLYGEEQIIQEISGLKFQIKPKTFFQTNFYQAQKLFDILKNYRNKNSNQTLFDFYCGTGNLSLIFASQFKKIIGIEIEQESVNTAQSNAQINGIKNCHFYCGDVFKICNQEFINNNGKPDVVILDPPRSGLAVKFLQFLLSLQCMEIIYISCNPSTQIRDLLLLKKYYTIKLIQPLDMFPHSKHIENIVFLTLK